MADWDQTYNEIVLVPLQRCQFADTLDPVIDNFNPPVGTPLVRSDSVSFDVTDNRALRRALVLVTLDGETYCVHDGFAFRGEFANPQSSRTPIVGGYHYIVKRNGGWTTPPTFEVLAIDTSGNEAT